MAARRDPIVEHIKRFHRLPTDPRLALLFPGQGAQKVGMGADVFHSCSASRAVFEAADHALKTGLTRLCFEGPEEQLTRTVNAQPAILTASLAYLVAALESGTLEKRAAYVAGHSLGEFSALVAAGALSFPDAVRLVSERGRLMEEAGAKQAGTMAAIVGLTEDQVAEICRESGAETCNFNARTQIVVGGSPAAVQLAGMLAKKRGGRSLPMNVAGAFHSSLMRQAADQFLQVLQREPIAEPALPVVSNVTAAAMQTASECRSDLERQIASPVRWHQSIAHMLEAGVRTFAESGPGRALSTMLKRDAPDVNFLSLDAVSSTPTPANV